MRFLVQIIAVLLLYSCSNVRGVFQRKQQVYQPPRLGAESRFEEGLRREKHPQHLFSKKERKDMERMGTLTSHERATTKTRITPMQADSILTGKTRDTTRTDSTQVIPADTTLPQLPDTTKKHIFNP